MKNLNIVFLQQLYSGAITAHPSEFLTKKTKVILQLFNVHFWGAVISYVYKKKI